MQHLQRMHCNHMQSTSIPVCLVMSSVASARVARSCSSSAADFGNLQTAFMTAARCSAFELTGKDFDLSILFHHIQDALAVAAAAGCS